VAKLIRLTRKIAVQLQRAVPFAVLAPGSQSGNFWILVIMNSFHLLVTELGEKMISFDLTNVSVYPRSSLFRDAGKYLLPIGR
jgi:hypothetical protein